MDPEPSTFPDNTNTKRKSAVGKRDNLLKKAAKDFFKGWNAFEYILLVLGIVAPCVLGIIFGCEAPEIVAGTLMIVMTLLLAKGKFAGYFVALVATGMYAWISWRHNLYGEVAIQIAIYLPISIFGIMSWAKNRRRTRTDGVVVVIGHVSYKELALLIFSQIAMGVGYYYLFRWLGTQQLVASVASVCLSVCGGYLLARRSRKAMWLNTASDIAGVVLWSLVLAQGHTAAIPLVVMEVLILASNFYGIFEWRNLHKKQRPRRRKKQTEPVIAEK